jgi:hypothetical protein
VFGREGLYAAVVAARPEVVEHQFTHIPKALDLRRRSYFYGPGTAFARDGSIAQQVLARKFPIVRCGTGVHSFIHLDQAASATVAAIEHGSPGIYSVMDDDPAALVQWTKNNTWRAWRCGSGWRRTSRRTRGDGGHVFPPLRFQ